jgi:pSer/pThr/pTyr-binding forkhead associated (FHA) protein
VAQNVLTLKNFEAPREEGVYYRLMCLTGQAKGEAYILKGQRVVLGRGDEADIKVQDIKSSREHAEITKVGDSYFVTDLGSQNGILVNNEKTKQSQLHEGDRLVIGQTVFKFTRVEVKRSTMTAINLPPEFKQTEPKKSPLNLFIGVVIVIFLLSFFMQQETTTENELKRQTPNRAKDVADDVVNALKRRQVQEDKNQKAKINAIFQRGLREYREKNYFRAINEFNLALILSPNDPLAEFYLRKTKEELDKVIADYFIKAKRDEEGLRYKGAMMTYCSIIRLLAKQPEDPRYKNAEEEVKELESKLGMELGETNCLKKPDSDQ